MVKPEVIRTIVDGYLESRKGDMRRQLYANVDLMLEDLLHGLGRQVQQLLSAFQPDEPAITSTTSEHHQQQQKTPHYKLEGSAMQILSNRDGSKFEKKTVAPPAPVLPSPQPTFEEVFEPVPADFKWTASFHSQRNGNKPVQVVQPVQPIQQQPQPVQKATPPPPPPATVITANGNHQGMVNGDLYQPLPNADTTTAVTTAEPEPEPIIEEVAENFDWASSPVNPTRPNPFAARRPPPPPAANQANNQQGRFRRPQRPAYNWD